MQRVVCHWTGGAYNVSEVDKEHYHFIIDGEGVVHKGYNDTDDNLNTGDGVYAAHTWGLNTGSIGVTVCCMGGATTSNFGKFPMKELQWKTMAKVVAELCQFYNLPVDKKHVLQHGEVTEVYGIDQEGKWDVCALPWAPLVKMSQVGDRFREEVKKCLSGKVEELPQELPTKLSKFKVFFNPKADKVRVFKDDVEMADVHLALQVKDGKIVAAKVDGEALNPKDLVSGSVEIFYKT
ncbi:MAG: N-acetylmuramoyl-L-alanine amidase [Candidatus Riesia sp.]|nr:N-acetylmuramoyl-L-alanine amidase [Candidatus Riesia sp.]